MAMNRKDGKLRLGTRGSGLATAQTRWVADRLRDLHPGLEVEILTYTTTGDRMQDGTTKPGGLTKGIFTKEIEQALLEDGIDLAVHSCKDLAAQLPEGLALAAIPERERVEDVLVTAAAERWEDWPPDGLVLTGSPRRARQWRELHPAAEVEPVRGNIETRVRKMLERPQASGCLLAWAGLRRLRPDLSGVHVLPLHPLEMIPAPGQGALALQTRAGDSRVMEIVSALDHEPSRRAVETERRLLIALEAGCAIPLGAWARTEGEEMVLSAVYYEAEGGQGRRVEERAPLGDEAALAECVAGLLTDE